MITIQDVSKYVGGHPLLNRISLQINRGDRIGLVGANGAGKTTLFRLIVGELTPDEGAISRIKGIKIGYLPQDIYRIEKGTVLEVAQRYPSRTSYENLPSTNQEDPIDPHMDIYEIEYKAKKILGGLGFTEDDFNRPISQLSGGWIMRVVLAGILLHKPDLLLLDEPTNHLDLETTLYLEDFLSKSKLTLFIISHDRRLLNRLVNKIAELESGNLTLFTGNYDQYTIQKDNILKAQEARYKLQQQKIREIEDFIARNRSRKDRARQVQARIKQLEKLEKIPPPPSYRSMGFHFPPPEKTPKIVMELSNIKKSLGRRTLFDRFSLVLQKQDKLAIVGKNGIGKSTLLKIMAGKIQPDAGERKIKKDVKIAYFSQDQLEILHPDNTLLEEMRLSSPKATEQELRSMLGAFFFTGNSVFKKVKALSGGERSRLLLCKILAERASLILLDEPLNHLDLSSQKVLEKALIDYEGTLCFISHDRAFINAIANKILWIDRTHIELFLGNWDDFERIWLPKIRKSSTSSTPKKSTSLYRLNRQKLKRQKAEIRQERYQKITPLKMELEKIEKEVEKYGNELDKIRNIFQNPDTYKEPDIIIDLKRQEKKLTQKLSILNKKWEKLALHIEELEREFDIRLKELQSS